MAQRRNEGAIEMRISGISIHDASADPSLVIMASPTVALTPPKRHTASPLSKKCAIQMNGALSLSKKCAIQMNGLNSRQGGAIDWIKACNGITRHRSPTRLHGPSLRSDDGTSLRRLRSVTTTALRSATTTVLLFATTPALPFASTPISLPF